MPREYFIVAPIPMIATPDNTQTCNEGQEHAVQGSVNSAADRYQKVL